MVQFAATDSWQDLLDYGWPINVAGGADPDEANCPIMPYLRGLGSVTVQQAVEALSGPLGFRAATWFLISMPDSFPDECRARLIEMICEDAPIASIVYQQAVGLTRSEKTRLWDAFHDALPVTTARLSAPDGGANG